MIDSGPADDNSAFIDEANITSTFSHPHLPYLLGVCITSQSKSLILYCHCIGKYTLPLHHALATKSRKLVEAISGIDWLKILRGVLDALDHLHCNHKIIHNDIKCDNIVLDKKGSSIEGIIIDFGKACSISDGKYYTLSEEAKEKYKLNHEHISPDL